MHTALDQPYAVALLELAQAGRLDAVGFLRDLDAVRAWQQQVPALRQILENPALPVQEKAGVIRQLSQAAGLAPLTRNFLLVLNARGRWPRQENIRGAFEDAWRAASGRVRAQIMTAREWSETERQQLAARLSQLQGLQVEGEFHADAGLLAGFRARVGDTVYDGSLQGQLERMRRHLQAL